jgi:hemin uptake protein HemP
MLADPRSNGGNSLLVPSPKRTDEQRFANANDSHYYNDNGFSMRSALRHPRAAASPAKPSSLAMTQSRSATPPTSSPQTSGAADVEGHEIDSARLLQGNKAVTIVHGGQRYVLRHTRQGKLILTK